MTTTQRLDRRTLMALAGGGAALAAAPALGAPRRGGGARPIVINALGGLENPNVGLANAPGQRNALDLGAPDVDARAIADARASGLTAVNITLGFVAGEWEPFEYSVKTIGVWDRVLREHPADLIKVYTAADILRAKRENRIGVIYGFQNSIMLGDDASRVDLFANLGVRVFQLTYNLRNQLGDGSLVKENRGLTKFGREAVERMNAARAMV
ncbi:MAG: membrane dipeptidase, partial [Caulobacteraceae bacterium]